MGIRNAAKAIVLHKGKILLNRCRNDFIGEYYALPGGGQRPFETMREAVIRECLEETGYRVTPEKFCALYEEIYTSPEVRQAYPDYAHKIYHLFVCRLESETRHPPAEPDDGQRGSVWVEIGQAPGLALYPEAVRDSLTQLAEGGEPVYLGSRPVGLKQPV